MLNQSHFSPIIIGGHSRGGHIALLYAEQDPRISLAIGIMPSSKLNAIDDRYKQWKAKGFAVSYRDLPEHKEKRIVFRVPFSHLEDHLKYDVIKNIKKTKASLILVAGELDKICPPKGIKKIFDCAHEPKKFTIILKIGHDYRHNDNEVKIVDTEILKLMKEVSA